MLKRIIMLVSGLILFYACSLTAAASQELYFIGHLVKDGEHLRQIVKDTTGNLKQLEWVISFNKITNHDLILPGEIIIIPVKEIKEIETLKEKEMVLEKGLLLMKRENQEILKWNKIFSLASTLLLIVILFLLMGIKKISLKKSEEDDSYLYIRAVQAKEISLKDEIIAETEENTIEKIKILNKKIKTLRLLASRILRERNPVPQNLVRQFLMFPETPPSFDPPYF